MTHVRRNTLLGIVLAAAFLAVLYSAGSEALDRPVLVDVRGTDCAVNLRQELIQQLPTAGRTFEPIAGIVPQQTSLAFHVDSKNRPTSATLSSGSYNWRFDKFRFNARDCSGKGEISRAEFGNGYSGRLDLSYLTKPEERVYLRGYNLRLNGGPIIKGDQLWFFKPMGTPVAEQPRPEDLPVVPPLQPTVVAPPGSPTAFQGPNGLVLSFGTLVDMKLSVLPHGDHEKHSVEYSGRLYYLCQFDIPRSQLRVYDTSPERFSLEKTSRPNLGWEWSPFECDRTGCRGEGKFFGQPIRASTPEVPQVNPAAQSAEGKLDIELNNSVVPFTFSARYKF